MSKTIEPADVTTAKLCDQVLKKLHPGLKDTKVDIALQLWTGKKDSPAVKVNGYECSGKVEFVAPHHRKRGGPDCMLILDGTDWEKATAPEREAILDHLLEQIEVRTKTKTGELIRDEANRPKLKRRKFDLRMAGFARVAEEHGTASIEAKAFAGLSQRFEQLKLFDDARALTAAG